jgi:hypothetical protein
VDTRGTTIPLDRHQAALKNARAEAAAEAIKQYAWTQGYNQDDINQALSLVTRLKGDSRGFYQQLGRELGEPQPQQQPPPPPRTIQSIFPAADLVSEDGKKAFSEGAVVQAFQNFAEYFTEQMDSRYAPVLQTVGEVASERHQAQVNAHYGGIAGDALAQARTLPSWNELQPEIAAELRRVGETNQDLLARQGAVGTMMLIYNRLYAEKVLPRLQAPQPGMVNLADLQRKANAERGSASASAPGSAAVRQGPKNVSELAQHMERIAASLGG